MGTSERQDQFEIQFNLDALQRIKPAEITDLTERATAATFYRDGLTSAQIAANQRIVAISAPSCLAAAQNDHQHLAAAFAGGRLAGYVIATKHGGNDLELDWLMVDPIYHGSSVSTTLMQAGIDWLGSAKPLWLNVIRYNERAIRFYKKFGFEIDPDATTSHATPHWVMRRESQSSKPGI